METNLKITTNNRKKKKHEEEKNCPRRGPGPKIIVGKKKNKFKKV